MDVEATATQPRGTITNNPSARRFRAFRSSSLTLSSPQYNGTTNELRDAIERLKTEHGFTGDRYNILSRNCNHFACNFSDELVGKGKFPAYVNRAAYFGSFFSCLIPKEVLGAAPVGGAGSGGGGGSSLGGGGGRSGGGSFSSGGAVQRRTFEGKGTALGSSSSGEGEIIPLIGGGKKEEKTMDAREMARLERLKRFEGQGGGTKNN